MKTSFTALALTAIASMSPVSAQQVFPCGVSEIANTRYIAEPWEDNTQTFANGAVRIALLDTLAPVSGSLYLMVTQPSSGGDDYGLTPKHRNCHVIGWDAGRGFSWLDLFTVAADEGDGLDLEITGGHYDPETDTGSDILLNLNVSLATGEVAASYEDIPAP